MLPAYPWDQRPDDNPLTVDEVCASLAEHEGDIRAAAERLKVGSLILRKFVERSSRARAVVREANLRLADEAASELRAALRDPDARRRDWAIRYVLNSPNAASLGWAPGPAADAENQALKGPLVSLTVQTHTWADGTPLTPPQIAAKVIEHVPAPASPTTSPAKANDDAAA